MSDEYLAAKLRELLADANRAAKILEERGWDVGYTADVGLIFAFPIGTVVVKREHLL